MLGAEANSSETLVIEPAVTGIFWQEKRVMNSVSAPEGRSVLVILKERGKDRALLDVRAVIRVEPDEQKLCLVGSNPLVWLPREHLIEC